MSHCEPHPIAQLIADGLERRGSTWALPAPAAARVRMMLLALNEDQAVGDAVRTVFAMVSVLQSGAGDPAAKALIRTLAKIRDDVVPRLRGCDPKGLALGQQLRDQARALLPESLRAPQPPSTDGVGALTLTEQERFQRTAEAAVSAIGSAVNKLQGDPPPGSLSVRSLNLPPLPQPWLTARKGTTPKANEAPRPAPSTTSRSSGPLPRRRFA